jgi:hypothetical protein
MVEAPSISRVAEKKTAGALASARCPGQEA